MVIWLNGVLKQYSQIVGKKKNRLVLYFKDVAFKIALRGEAAYISLPIVE